MLRGVKEIGRQHKIDNFGDGIYELTGKWKKTAKQSMHRIVRSRQKAELNKFDKSIEM